MSRGATLRLLGAVAALVALGAVVFGGAAASARPAAKAKAKATTIKMVQDGRELFFDGPKTVAAGTELKIKNTTNPKRVGPHTFSLVKGDLRPKTKKQLKRCGHELKGICGAVVKWHKVDLRTGEVGENPVEVGKDGWDQQGSLERKGDSWVAEKKNQTFAREVSAAKGRTLHFLCVVHPEMQGKIKVVR